MKAILEGNAYKYWSSSRDGVRLHVFNFDAEDRYNFANEAEGRVVTPNDICEDITYAQQAYKILSCCGTGSVMLHFGIDDSTELVIVPKVKTSWEQFSQLMFRLYGEEPFEMWDEQTNTEMLCFDLL